MTTRWLITDREDDLLQGLTADAQVIYVRGLRRYADFDTGEVQATHGMLKRLVEFLPDTGSTEQARRVSDISTDYIRARVNELVRAGLVSRLPKASRFSPPLYRCAFVRPEYEPQGNPKEGTPTSASAMTWSVAGGAPGEPRGMNPDIPGIPVYRREEALSVLPEQWKTEAESTRRGLDLELLWEKFADYYGGKVTGGPYWESRWQDWVKSEKSASPGGASQRIFTPAPPPTVTDREAALDQLRQMRSRT